MTIFRSTVRDFRRRLGIESEQAMELFHQTVSMKSVGNLTDFVRDHMLEPFDAASWTQRIVTHFEDLTEAHEAVRRAQAQLDPARARCWRDCDAHDRRALAEIQALAGQRVGAAGISSPNARPACSADRSPTWRPNEPGSRARAGGGSRRSCGGWTATPRPAWTVERGRSRRKPARRDRPPDQRAADTAACETADGKVRAVRQPAGRGRDGPGGDGGAVRRTPAGDHRGARLRPGRPRLIAEPADGDRRARQRPAEGRRPTRSTPSCAACRSRKNNIPTAQSGTAPAAVHASSASPKRNCRSPGELIQVRPDESDWEGAAERLLHSFALSVLVPDGTLRGRVGLDQQPSPERAGRVLPGARRCGLRAGPGSPPAGGSLLREAGDQGAPVLFDWLERELPGRARLPVCRDRWPSSGATPRAITKAGQIKDRRPAPREGRPEAHRRPESLRTGLDQRDGRSAALLRRAAKIQDQQNALAVSQQVHQGRAESGDRPRSGAGRPGRNSRVRRDRLAVAGQPA